MSVALLCHGSLGQWSVDSDVSLISVFPLKIRLYVNQYFIFELLLDKVDYFEILFSTFVINL